MGWEDYKGLKAKIIKKAASDAAFRTELLKDPKTTLKKEFGMDVPADYKITFHDSTRKDVHIVLPGVNKLSDDELAAVAGGRLGAWSCACGPSIG